MRRGWFSLSVGAAVVCWSPPLSAGEPASASPSPSQDIHPFPKEAAEPPSTFEPYSTAAPRLAIPSMDLPSLPRVADPFEGAAPLEISEDPNASVSSAPHRQRDRAPSADELRDPFSDTSDNAAWAANLQPHRFDALLDLLDPFRERDSSASSYRALAITQRASNGLRDPFALDARPVRNFGDWATGLRNPFDPQARPTFITPDACQGGQDTPRSPRCRATSDSLQDPFNSR